MEYNLIGNSLVLDFCANMNLSDEDGWTPEFLVWIEKHLVRFGKQRFGISFWGYENLDGPMSTALYLSLHRYSQYGLKGSLYAGGHIEADSIRSPDYWLKWGGPSLKSSITYKFRSEISVDARMNLFYGFVLDGPDATYDNIQKLSGSWGLSISWLPKYFGIFAGLDQFYNYQQIPSEKKNKKASSRKSLYTQLKAGVKWNI